MKQAAEQVAGLMRFMRDLPAFFNDSIDVTQAQARLRHNLEHREQRFLTLVDRAIFGHPRNPYLPLLRHAGASAATCTCW